MSKKYCTIYFGRVINSDVGGWVRQGACIITPVKQVEEGRPPLGRAPEFCCEEFGELMHDGVLQTRSAIDRGEINVLIYDSPYQPQKFRPVHFCPFCGAKIVFREDLRLRTVTTSRIVDDFFFEKHD